MKKLDNSKVAKKQVVNMQQMCGPSTNCQTGGCSCSKCFDSQNNSAKHIKEIYKK